MSHIYHPNLGDPARPAILVDGCPSCRVCGCTDDRACAGGCYWIQSRLCSACLGAVRRAPCADCGANPGNAWCRRPSGHSGPMVAFHRARIEAAAKARAA